MAADETRLLVRGFGLSTSRWQGWLSFVAIIVVSAAFAVFMVGAIRLDPSSTLWLNDGDIAQHYLGWHFFRGEPWSFPLGSNPRYGLDMGSSIVFTDSIPLLALVFKLLRDLLPAHFQYAGLWMVLCFVAQGVSATLLLRRFSDNTLAVFLGACFFVFSPLVVWRSLGHFALVGQWTILLALWLYFSPRDFIQHRWAWRILLCASAGIHGYLLYFVFAIWCATIGKDWHRAGNTIKRVTAIAFTLAILIVSMAVLGWFAVPFGAAAFGSNYGNFAANLDALINPPGPTTFLPSWKQAPTASGLESLSYLGAGVLTLAALSLITSVRVWSPASLASSIWHHRFLLFVIVTFSMLAFTHNVYWGEIRLIELPLPEVIRGKLEFIRGSGRLLWLLHYCVILVAIVAVCRLVPKQFASLVIGLALAVQVIDLYPMYQRVATGVADIAAAADAKARSTTRSAFWPLAATLYDEVNFFPIAHSPPGYEPIALWAGDHHIAINAAYFGRISAMRGFARLPQLEKELTTGTRRANVLYLLLNRSDLARVKLQPNDGVGEVDGMIAVAPDWFSRVSDASNAALLTRIDAIR